VREFDPERWAGPFIEAAQELERMGVDVVTTTCGLLVLLRHLRAAGIVPELDVAVQGLDEVGGHFTESIVGDRLTLDPLRCREEHEEATRRLLARHPDIGAIVLECTNMPPYAQAIAAVSHLPVYDITTLVRWGASSVVRGIHRDLAT